MELLVLEPVAKGSDFWLIFMMHVIMKNIQNPICESTRCTCISKHQDLGGLDIVSTYSVTT